MTNSDQIYYEKLVESIPLCVKLFDLVIAVRQTANLFWNPEIDDDIKYSWLSNGI